MFLLYFITIEGGEILPKVFEHVRGIHRSAQGAEARGVRTTAEHIHAIRRGECSTWVRNETMIFHDYLTVWTSGPLSVNVTTRA